MKKSYILMLVALVCMVATGCTKDALSLHSFRISESGFNDPDAKLHFTLGSSSAPSKLAYDAGDAVLVNGHQFTLRKSGSDWYADASDGSDVEANRFYCIYVNPNMNINGSGSSYNYSTSFSGSPAVATHNGVILAGSTTDSLLTLNPACAIIRFPAEGAQMDYVRVGFSPNTIPSGGSITISDAGVASITPTGYFGGVTTNFNGQFLQMVTDATDGYNSYYVAVPMSSSSVSTQLFITWKYNASEDVYKYKTSGNVTLQRGKVYTIGTTRTSPFNDDGSTKKLFNVGGGKYVYFSSGNLQFQYKDATVKWRFAEHQYDTRGAENVNVSPAYDGWIDLFGWGTSGWRESGATARAPYATSTTNSDYYPGGSSSNDLTGSYADADWGVFWSTGGNHIYYGNTQSSASWRTLTSTEWNYLISGRTNASDKWGYATIAGTYKGVVILPDSWSLPAGLTFNPGKASQWTTNEYTMEQWGEMEYEGAVFLPTTGYRDGTTLYNLGSGSEDGRYWSTTHSNDDNAYGYRFSKTLHQTTHSGARHFGYAVRLVKEFEDPFAK